MSMRALYFAPYSFNLRSIEYGCKLSVGGETIIVAHYAKTAVRNAVFLMAIVRE